MSYRYCFDAAAILGIGTPSNDPLPAPDPAEIVLRIPDGLSLQALYDSTAGKQLMWQQDWYEDYPWLTEALPAGTYRLRIPVPGSDRKTVDEQVAMLPVGESLAPVALVAAALLCIRLQGGADPLNEDWIRCAEQANNGRVVVSWFDGDRLSVDYSHVVVTWYGDRPSFQIDGDEGCYSDLWASSIRQTSP